MTCVIKSDISRNTAAAEYSKIGGKQPMGDKSPKNVDKKRRQQTKQAAKDKAAAPKK